MILHEKSNKGLAIIKKLVDESQSAGYAITLSTLDDLEFLKGKESESEELAHSPLTWIFLEELALFLNRYAYPGIFYKISKF